MHKVSPYGNIEGLWTIIDSMGMSLSKRRKFVMDKEAWRTAIHGVAKSWTLLSNWTEPLSFFLRVFKIVYKFFGYKI